MFIGKFSEGVCAILFRNIYRKKKLYIYITSLGNVVPEGKLRDFPNRRFYFLTIFFILNPLNPFLSPKPYPPNQKNNNQENNQKTRHEIRPHRDKKRKFNKVTGCIFSVDIHLSFWRHLLDASGLATSADFMLLFSTLSCFIFVLIGLFFIFLAPLFVLICLFLYFMLFFCINVFNFIFTCSLFFLY